MSTPRTPFDFERALKHDTAFSFVHRYLPVDRFIVRPPAALLVRAVLGTSVTPNQLTVCSFVLGLAGGFAYLGGTRFYFALAGTLVMLSTIFDCADGMLARTKNMVSRFGAYLDLFLDRIADFAVLVGMSVGYSLYVQDFRYLVFGLLTVGLYLLQVNLFYVVNTYKGRETGGGASEAKCLVAFLIFALSILGRLDAILGLVFLIAFISLIGRSIRFLARGPGQTAPPSP